MIQSSAIRKLRVIDMSCISTRSRVIRIPIILADRISSELSTNSYHSALVSQSTMDIANITNAKTSVILITKLSRPSTSLRLIKLITSFSHIRYNKLCSTKDYWKMSLLSSHTWYSMMKKCLQTKICQIWFQSLRAHGKLQYGIRS